jgi:hypothetical protein
VALKIKDGGAIARVWPQASVAAWYAVTQFAHSRTSPNPTLSPPRRDDNSPPFAGA